MQSTEARTSARFSLQVAFARDVAEDTSDADMLDVCRQVT
jgi:hypothetical protein